MYGITLDQFFAWNPTINTDCSNLYVAEPVCVAMNGGSSSPPTTSAAATSSAPPSVTTPSPVQAGMTNGCDDFYLVKSGDTCNGISSSYRLSLNVFFEWNPAIGTSCSSLWAGYYVCVGLATPSPTQAGISSRCYDYYLVATGDTCYDIVSNLSKSAQCRENTALH
jgi:hypothetical protein